MHSYRKPHVFISYVREDREVVERLCAALKRNGIEVWLDREKIRPGERWQIAIRRAIEEGAFFVACFSPAYSNRGTSYMNVELTIAVEQLRSRPTDRAWFIPMLFHGGTVPDRPIGGGETLRDIQWVDLAEDWDNGLRQVLSVLLPESREPLPEPSLRKKAKVLLVTDVVVSTSAIIQLGEQQFLATLLRISHMQRAAVAHYEGEQVTVAGDSRIAAFESASKAIACSLAIQRGISQSENIIELKCRIGLAAGPVLGVHSEVFGVTANLAARICSLAEGGEILASESVHRLAQVEGIQLLKRSLVALKGFTKRARIYEVVNSDSKAL